MWQGEMTMTVSNWPLSRSEYPHAAVEDEAASGRQNTGWRAQRVGHRECIAVSIIHRYVCRSLRFQRLGKAIQCCLFSFADTFGKINCRSLIEKLFDGYIDERRIADFRSLSVIGICQSLGEQHKMVR